ncbi:MAG: hypothetical protein Kow0069_00520 [Promethearchaeota archaeon]
MASEEKGPFAAEAGELVAGVEPGRLKGVPAMLYTGIWPYAVEGRLRVATKGLRRSVLVNLVDWPPAALLEVDDGDFRVVPVDDPAAYRRDHRVDVYVEGTMAHLVTALKGLGALLKLLLTRRLRVKGLRRALPLRKIFEERRFDLGGREQA